jgi:tryptophan synthase alpha chain
MNRLDTTLAALKEKCSSALACYFTAGDPDFDSCLALLRCLGAAGTDIIELGIPFSDPVADGPVIQAAHLRARAAGQTLARTLELVSALRQTDQNTPVVLMGYLNPVLQYGIERFMTDASGAGVDALLLVDLPLEHATEVRPAARAAGIHIISMTAPTSDDARLAQLLKDASGFVYHVSLNGITGAAQSVAQEVGEALARVHRHTGIPVAVGFGIRTCAQASLMAQTADIVVVGSALVDTLSRDGIKAALAQVAELAEAVHSAR